MPQSLARRFDHQPSIIVDAVRQLDHHAASIFGFVWVEHAGIGVPGKARHPYRCCSHYLEGERCSVFPGPRSEGS